MSACGNPPLIAAELFSERVLGVLTNKELSSRERGKIKQDVIRELVRCYSSDSIAGELSAATGRLDEVAKYLVRNGYWVIQADFIAESRVLVGLSEGVLKQFLEVGAVIDPVLALPYIPGSSVKGLIRHFLRSELGSECLAPVCELLGPEPGARGEGPCGEWAAGKVFIADAYPVGVVNEHGFLLVPDIITPHYYKGGEPVETELDARPVPVPHVSVAEGTVFRFVIGFEEGAKAPLEKIGECLVRKGVETGRDWLTTALTLLAAALAVAGVGGRTTKGYGTMRPRLDSMKVMSPGGGEE